MVVALVLFWAALLALAWTYALYPLVACAFGRLRPVRLEVSHAPPRAVTVGIAVHDGAAQIEERVANILEEPLPFAVDILIASDGSTDETPDVVRRRAAIDGRIRLLELPRVGQSAAQSAIFDAAQTDIVILTDLDTRFAPGCLAALVAPFADGRVGCVTGVLRWRYDASTTTARDEGLYWRYEQVVRSWESRAGWLAAGTGALMAVRRATYRPAPAQASLDQMLPLFCRQAGRLVLVEPAAEGIDRGAASFAEQFASRVRIATQGIEANIRMSIHVAPWRWPGAFLAIWSHKILRWATPYLVATVALSGLVQWLVSGDIAYAAGAALVVGLGALALVGFVATRQHREVPFTGFPLTLAVVNLAFAAAWLNVILRRPVRSWD